MSDAEIPEGIALPPESDQINPNYDGATKSSGTSAGITNRNSMTSTPDVVDSLMSDKLIEYGEGNQGGLLGSKLPGPAEEISESEK